MDNFHNKNSKDTILVVCYANYCRSPVAEILLENFLGDTFYVISAGIKPYQSASMDPRSINFLIDKNIKPKIHNTKACSRDIIMKSKYIFCFSESIRNQLTEEYVNFRSKFRLINTYDKSLDVSDPFKFKDKEYNIVMNNIFETCKILASNLLQQDYE